MTSSLTFRVTLSFALIVTVTVILVLALSCWLLHQQLLTGLDLLNAAEFEEINALLGDGKTELTPETIEQRIRAHTDIDAALYYFQVQQANGKIVFRSSNLGDETLSRPTGPLANRDLELGRKGRVHLSEFEHGSLHIQIAAPLQTIDSLEFAHLRAAGVVTLLVAIGSLGLGYGFSRYSLDPVRSIQ